MRHACADYQRIQDPSGKIPEDEPVFLLRAQDETAAETVRYWAGLQPEGPLRTLARSHVLKMNAWPKKKRADGPAPSDDAQPPAPAPGGASADVDLANRRNAACVIYAAWAARDAASRREPLAASYSEKARLEQALEKARREMTAFEDREATMLALNYLLPGWVALDVSDLLPEARWNVFVHESPYGWQDWLIQEGIHPNTAERFVVENWPGAKS